MEIPAEPKQKASVHEQETLICVYTYKPGLGPILGTMPGNAVGGAILGPEVSPKKQIPKPHTKS